MSLTRTVDPATEPITLAEAKTHLRISTSADSPQPAETLADDAYIEDLIIEAREYVENVTGRALITQTFELKLDAFQTCIKIPRPPLQSVSSVQYQDASDATQTLAASNYTVDADSEPGRLVESNTGTYPSTYPDLDAVTITFVAGYGTADDVPEIFKRAIKLYIEKMYDMPVSAYAESLGNALESLLLHKKIDWMAL